MGSDHVITDGEMLTNKGNKDISIFMTYFLLNMKSHITVIERTKNKTNSDNNNNNKRFSSKTHPAHPGLLLMCYLSSLLNVDFRNYIRYFVYWIKD